MKTLKLLGILFIGSIAAHADLTAVVVDSSMLHSPSAATGVAYNGTVQ